MLYEGSWQKQSVGGQKHCVNIFLNLITKNILVLKKSLAY